jgi:glucuronoxylan 4-O-methyltransferase
MNLDAAISSLVALDANQCTAEEYSYLANLIAGRRGVNLLVFGAGNDSSLWLLANQKGRTLFLEDSAAWLNQVKRKLLNIEILPVRYYTRRSEWRELLAGDPAALTMDLPEKIMALPWDVIFVDAPRGFSDDCPGRMKSIYTASLLASRREGVDVIVHDCDRAVERVYCERFLAEHQLIKEFERTRHYRTGPARVD